MSRRAAVVGAGIGGLSAAALLAKTGWEVDVYEQAAEAGGKAKSLQLGRYRFDTGPSLFTMPWVFRDFFAALGLDMADWLRPLPLEPLCRYFWPDGSRLQSSACADTFGKELAAFTGRANTAAELERYFAQGRWLWQVAGELFLCRSLHEADTYRSPQGRYSIPRLPGIGLFRSLHQANAQAFSDPRLVQLFDRYATYNGSSPFKTPATMRIIPHVEYSWGGWALEGGIVEVARSLERAALHCGARLHCNTRVQDIGLSADGRRVNSVTIGAADGSGDSETRPYDIVVSNADVLSTYSRLLKQPAAPEARRYRRLTASSSGIVFLWGIRRRFAELLSHNIFFSSDYRQEFDQIFGGHGAPDDPTIYVNITGRTSPDDNPPDGENWFVLVNVSHDSGQDWPAIANSLRQRVLTRLSAALGVSIAELIEEEKIITPVDIERDTGSTYGSLYGIASNQRLAAFLRHPNRSRRIGGLYFAGGSAHPGGGMPLALLSGSLAAELANKYEL